MNQKELTDYENRRRRTARCPICGEPIYSDQDFTLIKIRNRKAVVHNFIHNACLRNPKKYEKEGFKNFMNEPEGDKNEDGEE